MGTVYELSPFAPLWKETILHSFSDNDGATVAAGLIFDNPGKCHM